MAQSSDCNGWFAKWLIINLLLAIFYRYFSRLLVGKNNIDNWQIWRVGFIFIKVHRDPIPRWSQLIALSWKHFTQFPAADLVSIDIKYIIHHNIINWLWDVESMKRLSLSVDSRYFWVTYNDYNVGIFSAKCQSAKVTILNGKWVTAFQTSLEIVLYGLK